MNTRIRSIALAAVATTTLGLGTLVAPAGASALEPASATVTAPTDPGTAPGTVASDLTIGNTTISGSKASNVTCTVRNGTYTVKTSRVTVNGHQVNGSVVVKNYTGPGTYTATVALKVTGPKATAAGMVKGVQVTITETGGTWSFATTATGAVAPKLQGKTISGSLSYGCNA